MIIAARFNGPPDSGNGGYSAGMMAAELSGSPGGAPGSVSGAEVTLRRPPPLDTPLDVRPLDGGGGEAALGAFARDDLIMSGHAVEVRDDPVAPVDLDRASAASATYHGFVDHPFPTCYVCGPKREDGLRIFPGRIAPDRTAAAFVVPADVSPAVVWAALDCPGGWAVPMESRAYVLGRVAARVDAVPAPGDTCVVVGQLLGEEGRKAHVRTTLYGPTGALLATARATWIAL